MPYLVAKLMVGLIFAQLLVACNSQEPKNTQGPVATDTLKPDKKNEHSAKTAVLSKAVIINFSDTIILKRKVLCMKDSAADMSRVALKLSTIYGIRLQEIIKKNGLKIGGQPLAWYATSKAPFFFEAGIPVDKLPAKLPAGVYSKEIKQDSAIVAHFFGSYNMVYQAYAALSDWMKDHKKKSIAPPFEVYITDPVEKSGKPLDPLKIQTDIVFPYK